MKDSRRNLFTFRAFIREYLNVQKDETTQSEADEYIRNSIDYKGSSLWILIFSILIASLGMNVNSPFAIIGAMLISPMMGPIMGVGLALGVNDFYLMKRSLRSYMITTLFSVGASTIYFLISPITTFQSVFALQTSPTIYNVLIALFGGLAGFIALSTTKKGTVVVGVAIVTALIPPLCTAGYGLASGNLVYFMGALYLYIIESVFICFATFLGVRMLHYPKKEFINKKQERKVRQYMFIVVFLSMCPTIYLTAGIIKTAIFTARANRFITEQLTYKGSSIIYKNCNYKANGEKFIQLVLVGDEIPQSVIQQARRKLGEYQLENTELNVMQGANNGELDSPNPSMHGMMMKDMKSESYILSQHQQNQELKQKLGAYQAYEQSSKAIMQEAQVLFPAIKSLSVGRMLESVMNTNKMDTISVAVIQFNKKVKEDEKKKIADWLKVRLDEKKDVKLILK